MADMDDLRARGDEIFAPHCVGRPGRGAIYWPLWVVARVLRVPWSIRLRGAEHLAPGPAILVGNHLRAIDPVVLGVALRRRLVFVAKAEALSGVAGFFLRRTGQVPLIRGDEAATRWALAASAAVLRDGRVLCVYPEATRSPDGRSLHRLHRRVLMPLIESSPTVPVHAVAVGYPGRRLGRTRVDLRISPPLPIEPDVMTDEQVTIVVRDALLELGGMPYVDRFGTAVKAAQGRANRVTPP